MAEVVVPPGCKLPAAGFLGRLHVLVVDDDAVYLEELKLTLLLSGYAVTGKTTAEEALQELDRNPEDYFDIIMTDVHMPGMDGFDLLHGVKGRLPVIMFSEDEDVRTVMRGVLDGACDYLLKPMTSDAIRIIWKHVLGRRLSALPPQAPLLPSDRQLAAALSAVASPPPPSQSTGSKRGDGQEAVLAPPPPPAPTRNRRGDVQEAAAVVPAVSSRGDGQEAAPAGSRRGGGQEAVVVVAAGSSRGDGQEVPTNAASTKRGAPEVSDKGSNNFVPTKERKKARARFVWTTQSHAAFLRAYYQLKDEAGPKRIKELMEREGIFVTKTQVSSHLQKFRGWLETMKNQPEAVPSPNNQLSNYTDRQDRSHSPWKRSSIITEGPLAGMFCGRPVNHSVATSNGCFTATQSSYVGVGPKEIDNFISCHTRSQGTAMGHGSAIRQASLRGEVTSAGHEVHANGGSQARGNAISHGTSASHGVAVTNENLLQVISAPLPSNMRQPMQPSQSFSTNSLAANFSAVSDQNLGTSCATNSGAINNQNHVAQEMSVPQIAELGYGNNVMLDWPELGCLDDQLDNGVLMDSFFDGHQLLKGVVTATDGTQEMRALDSTDDFSSVPSEGLNTEFLANELNGASDGTLTESMMNNPTFQGDEDILDYLV